MLILQGHSDAHSPRVALLAWTDGYKENCCSSVESFDKFDRVSMSPYFRHFPRRSG